MKLKAYLAELIGTLFLTTSILGSAIAVSALSEDKAVRLLIVATATVVTLGLMISLLQPISGAHFNPAVSLVALINKQIKTNEFSLLVLFQLVGAALGAVIANLMFEQNLIESSTVTRTGAVNFFSELIATAGLLFTIMLAIYNNKPQSLQWVVPAWIAGAYFFTSSTSFANPAVTLARSLNNSFASIEISSVGLFVVAQFIGAVIGLYLAKLVKNH